MRRLIVTVAATFAMATATVIPAHAGIGGVRYLYVGGTVATNGTVTWKIVNYWHSDAMTTSKELGPVTALFLRTTYITDPTPLASGECDTVTVSGSWRDGYRLGGYLSATVCAP